MNERKNRYSGHQTFTFRHGWLEKGYHLIKGEKKFSDIDAIVSLGVGKNMVDSIRYWEELAGIISSEGEITPFGSAMLDTNNGWDPYLEDNASLWLIHWNIITNKKFETSGSALFSYLHKPEFSKREISEAIYKHLNAMKIKLPSAALLSRDIDCYIRTYAGSRKFDKMRGGEETFDCPLQDLGIIQPMQDGELYRFSIGPKFSLPYEIIGYAISDFLNETNRQTIRIQELSYQQFSPGRVFMLDENSIVDALESLHADPNWSQYFNFTESAGIALAQCSLPSNMGMKLLSHYYTKGTTI